MSNSTPTEKNPVELLADHVNAGIDLTIDALTLVVVLYVALELAQVLLL